MTLNTKGHMKVQRYLHEHIQPPISRSLMEADGGGYLDLDLEIM